jgi:hypothetical protein
MAKSSIVLTSACGFNAVVATSLTLAALGCTGNTATDNPVAMDVSQKVIKKYDKGSDGALISIELHDLDSIYYYMKKYDLDGDDKVSRDEIASRIDSWQDQAAAEHAVDVIVTLDGYPLAGANVRMVPEFDPGDGSQARVGQTDANGAAHIAVALEDLSQALKNPDFRGVFGSKYKIEVTHPQRKVPDRYNVNAELNAEVARESTGNEVNLDISTR